MPPSILPGAGCIPGWTVFPEADLVAGVGHIAGAGGIPGAGGRVAGAGRITVASHFNGSGRVTGSGHGGGRALCVAVKINSMKFSTLRLITLFSSPFINKDKNSFSTPFSNKNPAIANLISSSGADHVVVVDHIAE